MANIKSAKKRIRTIGKKSELNNTVKSSMKTAIKKYEKLIQEGKIEDAKNNLSNVVKKIDKAASAGVIKKNASDRYKSRLAKKVSNTKK